MPFIRHRSTLRSPALLLLLAGSLVPAAILWSQPAQPTQPAEPDQPARPAQQTPPPAAAAPAPSPAATAEQVPAPADAAVPAPTAPTAPTAAIFDPLGRRVDGGAPTRLGFRGVTVEQVIPFIVESTGKVVLPQQEVLARRITILNDRDIPRAQALDLVFLALQQTGVSVVENRDIILLRDQADIDRQAVPVLGPDVVLADRADVGSVAQKVFALRHASAANVGEILKPSIPDYAKLAIDPDSNQVLITGPVALLQRLDQVIRSLDKPAAAATLTETFFLRFADSEQIAANIRELFAENPQQRNQRQNTAALLRQFQQGGARPGQQGQPNQGNQQNQQQGAVAQTPNLRVTSNIQQNSVTVLAEATVIEQIRRQITEQWDRPLSEEAVVPKIYQLKNSDPIKVKEVLEGLFGAGSQTVTGTQFGQRQTSLTPGVGRLAGQFSFQAIPEAARLVVVSKSPDNMQVIDKIIEDLDQPMTAMLPEVVELKHASAEDLAEQLNALLAREGTFAQIRRVNTELSDDNATASPFATQQTGTDNQFAREVPTDVLNFWWQRDRVQVDNAGSSNIVAKARIVPVTRQNALMVLAPLEYRRSIVELIERLDRPGRQVLIAAVIAEISSDDATALGVRFSQTGITPVRPDNSVGIGANRTGAGAGTPQAITGTQNNFLPGLFDTSVLNVGVDINVLLQALAQRSEVRILSEPRIFTGDNQEANFFDGQDIPFITDTQSATGTTALIQGFDYRAVGIQLRVRPRITPERNVDLKVNLELSSVEPGNTLFGGAIVDRRETTTQLIVSDGQTVVISGILRTQDTDLKRKIPLLGDIPGLGAIFTSIERTKTNTELVAFITPIVVNNAAEMDAVNAPARQRLQDLRSRLAPEFPPPLQNPVDESAGELTTPSGPTPSGPTPAEPRPPAPPRSDLPASDGQP